MKVKNEERIARIEAICEKIRNAEIDVQESVLRDAIAAEDEELAASITRTIRNKLLDNSDKEMSLDRLGLDTSSAAKFIASLGKIFTGEWAKYRQLLRDLPEQEGFPFNIEFPTPPDSEEATNEPT